MSTVVCRHIKISGARCGSPALGGRTLCYHHMKLADCHRSVNQSPDIETILHPVPIEQRVVSAQYRKADRAGKRL